MTTMMRAAVVTGPGRAETVLAPIPAPEADQVRVRLEGCGVCASNLGPWAGPDWMRFPTAPGALGHEGWGVIDAIGRDVTGLREGQRVAFIGYHSYAEYDVAPAGTVVPLPPVLDGTAFPGEPLACAMNIFARSGIESGHIVAIVGLGFLGALLTALATERGATVIAVSRRADSRALGVAQGAVVAVPFEDALAAVEEQTGGRLCDVVIEATGKQAPLDLAARLCAERGRLVIAGYHQDGPRQIDMQLWNWRGLDVVNAHERDPAVYTDGMRRAVDAVASGRLTLAPLLSHRFPIEALGAALDMTRDRPAGFVKAVLCS